MLKKQAEFLSILILAIVVLSCDGDTDFQGLYTPPKPPEAGDTRTYDCPDKPNTGTEWNTISEYQQTWDGYAWQPADATTVYSETPSTTTCQYKCAIQYLWNGSYCALDTQNTYKVYECNPKPEGEGYEWNTVSQYNQMSSDQGVNYYPADDPTTEYNENGSTTSCQYKCAAGYTWNGTTCSNQAQWTSYNGYQWMKAPSAANWSSAQVYCTNIGGRLPTLSELRLLITNCPATQTGGDCQAVDGCLGWDTCRTTVCDGCSAGYNQYSYFGDTGWLWTISLLSDYADIAFTVNFDNGGINTSSNLETVNGNFRCLK